MGSEWVTLSGRWREQPDAVGHMLARVHPFLHIVHGAGCVKRWALVSATRFAEVMADCTCATVKYRPFALGRS